MSEARIQSTIQAGGARPALRSISPESSMDSGSRPRLDSIRENPMAVNRRSQTADARPRTYTAHPFDMAHCARPVHKPRNAVDNRPARRGPPAPERGRTAPERGPSVETAKPPHLAGRHPNATTTSCVFRLTVPIRRRIVYGSPNKTENARHAPPHGTIRRPGAAPRTTRSGQTARQCGSYSQRHWRSSRRERMEVQEEWLVGPPAPPRPRNGEPRQTRRHEPAPPPQPRQHDQAAMPARGAPRSTARRLTARPRSRA